MAFRIIPRLDIKGPNLVKGIHLEGLRVLGKPERFARFYYETGADELFFMDMVASLYGRNQLTDIVKQTAREIFIPLCVGGGLRSVDDIRTVLRAGADKVSLNTSALARPDFVREAAKTFGSSTIVVSIEAIRQPDGHYECFTDCGRQATGVDAFVWALRAAELGAGELSVTAVDREGTGRGYDLELTRRIAQSVTFQSLRMAAPESPIMFERSCRRARPTPSRWPRCCITTLCARSIGAPRISAARAISNSSGRAPSRVFHAASRSRLGD